MAFTSTPLSIARFRGDRSDLLDTLVSALVISAREASPLIDFAYVVALQNGVSADGTVTLATSVTGTVVTYQIRIT